MKKTTRQTIVEAARNLFSTWGYDGAGMEAIAAEAGVTKVTIYRHFENKEALFSAALQSYFDELPAPASVVPEGKGPLRSRLMAVGGNLLALGTGALMVRLHRMLSLPRESASTTGEELWEANFQPYHEAVQQLLKAEQETGALDIADIHAATTHFLSLVVGEPMVRLFLSGFAFQAKPDADRHLRAAVDVFLRAYG